MSVFDYTYFNDTCQCYRSKEMSEGWIVASVGFVVILLLLTTSYKLIFKTIGRCVRFSASTERIQYTPPPSPCFSMARTSNQSMHSECASCSSASTLPPPAYHPSRNSLTSSTRSVVETTTTPPPSPSPLPPAVHARRKPTPPYEHGASHQRTILADRAEPHIIPMERTPMGLVHVTRERHPNQAHPQSGNITGTAMEDEESLTQTLPVLRLPPQARVRRFHIATGTSRRHNGAGGGHLSSALVTHPSATACSDHQPTASVNPVVPLRSSHRSRPLATGPALAPPPHLPQYF